jgi:hypothetical protein
MILSWRRLAVLTVPVLLATACSSSADPDVDSSADEINYRSTAGQEFALSTEVTFKLSAETLALQGEEKDKAVLVQAQTLRDTVLTTITSELDKLWPEEERTSNAGVAIQYRQASASLRDLKASADGLSYSLTVSGEFAGIKNLEQRLPMKTVDAKKFLPISADLGAGAQELQVFITPVERSLNAYPKYLDMFADGLDIGVHLGGDHNTPPQDINHARSVYDDLVASGFRSPVAKFEDLKIDSGPLTSAIKVKGADVPVRVRIVHADMSTPETRNLLVDAYKASAKNADVIIYDGHAGRRLDYSGVVLAYNPARSSIPATEFKTFETTDKQQVYLFNGCETYTGYADKLYENPKRNPENTDIITTGNFSAIQGKANQVIAFIHSFIDQRSGAWIPRSWDSVLSKMNAVGERSWVHIYGVHGLDDNPKVSPLADLSKLGATCTTDAQCGAPDSKCIATSANAKVCGVACADSAGCPTGTKCVLPRGRTSADDQQCAAQ